MVFGCGARAQTTAPHAIETPDWFTQSFLDIREDVAEAAKAGKRLMLYFGQDGCPYCKRLMEVNWRQPEIVGKTRKHFVALALNLWGDREVTWTDGRTMTEKQLAAMLKVQFTPTLIFFDEKGGIALRLNGYLPPERFAAALDAAAGKPQARLSIPDHKPGGKALDLRRKPGGKPLAVVFVAPRCDPCDELEREAFARRQVQAQLARFDVVKLLLDGAESVTTPAGKVTTAGGWARTLSIGYAPSLVLFDARGREVFRTEAYLRPFHLAGALEYVASGAYAREPSFQRFLQAKAERMKGRGETVDLWN
jgi:thioredoxin-related protein